MAAAGRLVVATRLLLLLIAAGGVAASILVSVRGARTAEAAPPSCAPCRKSARGRRALSLCGMPLSADAARPTPSQLRHEARPHHRHHECQHGDRRQRASDVGGSDRELRGAAWVDEDGLVTAVYYDDQIDVLPPGERGWFSPSQAPQSPFPVRRTSEAKVRWDRSTSRIRFRVDGAAPTRGSVGWVEVPRKPREVLTVPTPAILQSAQGPYVLVPAGGYRCEKRSIEIGETFSKQKFAVVLSGLRLFEPVVSRAAFFLDADRRLAAAEDKP